MPIITKKEPEYAYVYDCCRREVKDSGVARDEGMFYLTIEAQGEKSGTLHLHFPDMLGRFEVCRECGKKYTLPQLINKCLENRRSMPESDYNGTEKTILKFKQLWG